MKTILTAVIIAVFSLISIEPPACADDTPTINPTEQQTQQKDECMLAAKHCGLSIMSLQDKIEKLKEDIEKGKAVYTPEELDILKQKLDDVNKTLDFLLDK
jgi:hypothetical protein